MTPIRDASELATAIDQPQAVLFLWVEWSMTAREARTLVNQASAGWQFPCYVLDVSDQSGALWDALAAWLTTERRPASALMFSGNGSLLWVRSGRVALHTVAPVSLGAATLQALTRSVF